MRSVPPERVTLYCETCRKPFTVARSEYEAAEKKGQSRKYCKRTCQPERRTKPETRRQGGK